MQTFFNILCYFRACTSAFDVSIIECLHDFDWTPCVEHGFKVLKEYVCPYGSYQPAPAIQSAVQQLPRVSALAATPTHFSSSPFI